MTTCLSLVVVFSLLQIWFIMTIYNYYYHDQYYGFGIHMNYKHMICKYLLQNQNTHTSSILLLHKPGSIDSNANKQVISTVINVG